MKGLLEALTTQDIDGNDPEMKVLELKLKALILDTVHNIDVVDQLVSASVRDVAEWGWQKQLRSVHFPSLYAPLFYTGNVQYTLHFLV